jgi:type III secretory pathway component EscT
MLESWETAELAAFGLVAVRIAPSGVLLGALSRGFVPWWLGLSLALALAGGLSPGLSLSPEALVDAVWWIPAVARELCLGLVFALAAALPWVALGWAVRVAERPVLAAHAPLATLYVLAAALLVLSLGGHRAYVGALSGTLLDVPLGKGALEAEGFGTAVLAIVGSAFGLSVSLGIPLWTALWLLDATLALVDRFAGGARELGRSPLRGALALLIFALMLAPLTSRTPELVRASIREARGRVSALAR